MNMYVIRTRGARPAAQGAAPATDSVTVFAPARLHLGFFDLDGALGRRFGSLGITLDDIGTEVSLALADDLRAEGPDAARALDAYARMAQVLNLPPTVHLSVDRSVPPHTGLGSGTQMALAVGAAAAELAGITLSARQTARLLGRGRRSGIGVAAFATGGVLVDGGCRPDGDIAPVISRLEFPERWRIVLIMDRARQGVHGAAEEKAFIEPPPFRAAADLCRIVLMQALPGLAEGDCDAFGRGVGALQRAMGDHFAPLQGGRFTSPDVARVLAWFESRGVPGVGQSSWGPTGFAIVDGEDRAQSLIDAVSAEAGTPPTLTFRICRGRNHGGGVVTATTAAPRTQPVARIGAARL